MEKILILVDSSVWIDFLRDTGSAQSAAFQTLLADGAEICVTEITVMEVLRGIRGESLYRKAKRDMLSLPVLVADGIETYIHASDIYRTARKSGITIDSSMDFIIAAIAIENDATILHHDSDFDKLSKVIPGLRTIAPQAILNR